MMSKIPLLTSAFCLGLLFSARAFDKIALMDSLDMAYWCDVETKEGTVKLIEDCLRPNSNVILWRDKGGGGGMRYPSVEEKSPLGGEHVIDKRVPTVKRLGSYWSLRLDDMGFDTFGFVFDECRKRNLGYGIHQTLEENHTANDSLSHWTVAHPQFWNRKKGGVPCFTHASLAYPEVMAHKMRFADEHLALKPQRIFFDIWRAGEWTLRYEFVKPNVEKWQKLYPGEPLPDDWRHDERWTRLAGKPMMDYMRAYGKKCRAAGVEFVVALTASSQSMGGYTVRDFPERKTAITEIFTWQNFGIDWRELVKEDAIDGIWLMDIPIDKGRVWEHLKESLDYYVSNAGKAKVYFGVNSYDMRDASYRISYAKAAGCTPAEAIGKMMAVAKEAGCAGVVYECVDCHCYKEPGVSEELKKW